MEDLVHVGNCAVQRRGGILAPVLFEPHCLSAEWVVGAGEVLFLALVDYWDPVGEEGPEDCVGGETEVGIVRRDAWVVMVFGKGA